MTLGEIKNAADNLWRANKDNSEKVAIAAFQSHDLPPIVHSLPNVPAFLADLQRRSFYLGVMAVLSLTLDPEDAVIAKDLQVEVVKH